MRTLVNVNPVADFRAMEEMMDRLFAANTRNLAASAALPIDVLERENRLIVRAAVPGVEPNELEIQVADHVLTLRGEIKTEGESNEDKVYRRELPTGRFARSIRLGEDFDLDAVEAEFRNGIVTITIPRRTPVAPMVRKIEIRTQA